MVPCKISIPQAFKCLINITIYNHQLNLSNYYPLSCIEAVDKNPVKIQIRVLVFTDARHNQDGRAQYRPNF